MRKRADVLLVEKGLFASRARAQEAIAAGLVRADGVLVRKPSETIAPEADILASAAHPWASRGGLKLVAALDAYALNPAELACLDIGASTGGFSDVLLSRGARSVVAVDVGRGQFDDRLAANPRVTLLEGFDARRLAGVHLREAPQAIV
jgi:23S rRNA (cytidine1920-2'-O)/16S rRNA (cytidine1409-2'-O)-methyltransferase